MSVLPDWLMIYQVSALGVVIFVLFAYLYWTRIRIFYRVDFYRKTEGGTFEKVGQKEFKKSATEVSFRKRTFFVNLRKLCCRDSNKTLMNMDFDTGKVLSFVESGVGEDSELNDELLSSGVFGRIVRGFAGLDKFTQVIILALVAGMGLCFALGLFVSPYLLPSGGGVVSNVTGVLP